MRRVFPALLTTFLVTGAAWADDKPPPSPDERVAQTEPGLVAPIPGLFDVNLPILDDPGTFHLILNPRSGDLFHHDYIRIPTGARWTMNDWMEVHAEAEVYTPNWFRHTQTGYGVAELNAGVKYILPRLLPPDYLTGFTFDVAIPLGSPPIDITDGLNHFTPQLVVEHHTVKYPRLTIFGGYGLDFVTHSFVHGTLGFNEPHDNSMSFNAGGFYDLGQFVWTYQTTYTTTALIGGHPIHVVSVQPSLIWFVPKRYTFNSKTQWIIGLAFRATWGPDGFESSTSSRVRADITFGQVMSRLRSGFDFKP